MKKTVILLLVIIATISCKQQSNDFGIKTVSTDEVEQMIYSQQTATEILKIIDVRTQEEYNTGHIKNALLVDWKSEQFDSLIIATLGNPQNDTKIATMPIIVYCLHGVRSLKASERMLELGYKNIFNMDKGIEQWIQENKELEYNYNYKSTSMIALEEIQQFVRDCGYYMIATADGNQPRVRPFGTINIYDDKIYIQTGHKKRIAKQLAENPHAEICAYNTNTGSWIRISGQLVEDNRIEAKKAMLDSYPNLRSMYDENDDNTAVYFFANGVAYISSFNKQEREIKF